MSRPWMPLYVADYLADTGHLTTAEHGAYLLLIMHYWQRGALPTDDGRLAVIVKMTATDWRKSKTVLAEFFDEEWKHKRLDKELTRAAEISDKRSAARQQRGQKASTNEPTIVPTIVTTNDPQKTTHAGATPQPPSPEERIDAADAASAIDPKTDLFNRGKVVLGPKSGGLINKLLQAKGSVPQARAALEIASTTSDPREYIGGCLKGAGGDDLRASGDAW